MSARPATGHSRLIPTLDFMLAFQPVLHNKLGRSGPRLAAVTVTVGILLASPAWPGDFSDIHQLAERGRTEDALRRLESLLVDEPRQLEGQFLRGVLLAELGRHDQAQRAFRALSRDYPERPETIHNLAVLQAMAGRPATAIIALVDLLERYPGYETAASNLDRIRRGGFDPLNQDASQVALELTPRLGDLPPAAPVEEFPGPQPTAEPAEPEAPPAQSTAELEAPPATPMPEPEAQPVAPTPEPAAGPGAETMHETTTVVPEPVPAAPAAQASDDLRSELESLVGAWAAAWSRQRVREYLDFYAAEFQPTGFPSREAWEAVRRQRVASPSFIEVEIDPDSLTVHRDGPGEASVAFIQRYRSDRYSDTVRKTLGLVRQDGVWRIQSEVSR